MAMNRDEGQKRWGCLSASLLIHGAIGATVALAPLANAKKEQPSAVYLQDSSEIPKGEQLETLPPAQQVAKTEVQEAPKAEPVAAAPVVQPQAQVVKAKEALPAKLPAKKIATTLPQKKTTTQAEPDISVKSALAAARADEKQAESNEQGEPLLSPAALAQQKEAEGLKPEAPQEDSASAATTETAEEETEVEPIQKDTPAVATVAATEATENKPEAKTEAPAAAAVAAPAQAAPKAETKASAGTAAPTNSTGSGNGAQNAPAAPYGVRDAESLRQAPGNKNPVYPERDRLARQQGTTVFLARVRPDGTVTDIKLQQSSNSKTLDASAQEAMKNWRFLPGQEGMIRKAFQFSLNGNAQELPARLRR